MDRMDTLALAVCTHAPHLPLSDDLSSRAVLSLSNRAQPL